MTPPSIVGTPATFASASAATSHTFSYTSDATGTNRALIVMGASNSGNNTAWSGVTYNGVSMSQIVSVTGAQRGGGIMYYLAAPDTGANNVVISSGASRSANAIVFNLQDCAQSSPVHVTGSNVNSGSTTTLTPSLTTTNDNTLVIGWILVSAASSGYTASNGTIIASINGNSYATDITASHLTKTTAGAQNMGFTWTANGSCDGYVTSLTGVVGGGGDPTPTPTLMMMGCGT